MRPVKVTQLVQGLSVFFEEDVFFYNGKRYVYLGKRVTVARVNSIFGQYANCTILNSAGANPEPIGARVSKNLMLLKGGYVVDQSSEMKAGGHLEGTENGTPVKLDTAEKGGMSVGAKHSEDGIKGVVGTEERPIEFEGEEIILTAPVANNPDKYEFEGQMMTGREIASKINEDNGGVSFADGGDVSYACRCSGKQYKFGGISFADNDIIRYIDFVNKQAVGRMAAVVKK